MLVEDAGRYSLATCRTLFEGWVRRDLDHVVLRALHRRVGIRVRAAAMAGTGLALYASFEGISVTWWGIFSGLIGHALVWSAATACSRRSTSPLPA